MRRIKAFIPLFALAWFGLVLLACNLTSQPEPPTLVARMTETPQPTIAYATLSPQQLPQQTSANMPSVQASLNSLIGQVDSDRLFLTIDTLVNFGTRHVNSADLPTTGVKAAWRYVSGRFKEIQAGALGGNFQVIDYPFQLDYSGVQSTQYNVIGISQGQEIGGGVILLGAHYDSISLDPNDTSYVAPGANDDASGMAALLEVARILSSRPHRATIMFLAFGAEEVGRKGSAAFADYLRQQGIALDVMINLDIIGSSTGPNGQIDDSHIRLFSEGPNDGTPSASRQVARALAFFADRYMPSMTLQVQDAVDRQGRYGDHMSFSGQGWGAVRFIEPLEERNRQHTPQDTMNDIQASYLTKVTQMLVMQLTVLADGPAAPRNLSLRPGSTPDKRILVWEASPSAVSYIVALRRPGALTFNPAESFPWNGNSVEWDGFRADQFAGVVVYPVNATGLLGSPSAEYGIS